MLGTWMVVQAVWFDAAASQLWNDVFLGAVLLVAGGYDHARRASGEIGRVGVAIVVVLVGLWPVLAPFGPGDEICLVDVAMDLVGWNDVLLGLLAIVIETASARPARAAQRGLCRATERSIGACAGHRDRRAMSGPGGLSARPGCRRVALGGRSRAGSA